MSNITNFLNLTEKQQNYEIYKMLVDVDKRVDDVEEQLKLVSTDCITSKANLIDLRKQVENMLAIAEPAVIESMNRNNFAENDKLNTMT
jgi:hypothetical protein